MINLLSNNKRLTETETDVLVEVEEEVDAHHSIILFNDDVNTFQFVIESLIEVCGHDLIQAEQCTYLVHYAGKCSVKSGSFNKLVPICSALLDRGLTAEIE
jgi:ATP-dependent Clp protease adaptor protein ClpS